MSILLDVFRKFLSELNKYAAQLTWGERTRPTVIYINARGMGRIMKNTFEPVDYVIKTYLLGFTKKQIPC
jgi:hypothetical protein